MMSSPGAEIGTGLNPKTQTFLMKTMYRMNLKSSIKVLV
jgi:hypothetical protein